MTVTFGTIYTLVDGADLGLDDSPLFPYAQAAGGYVHLVYRLGGDHNSTPGDILYCKRLLTAAPDAALSDPVVALTRDPEIVTDPSLFVTSTGRIWVFTTENDGGTLKGHGAYSDNGGVDWTDVNELPTHSALTVRHSPISMWETGGKLYRADYGVGTGAKYQVAIVESIDDGITVADTVVAINGNTYGLDYEEPVFGVLSDGTILGVMRVDDRGGEMVWVNAATTAGPWPVPAKFACAYSRAAWCEVNGKLLIPVRGKAYGGVDGQPALVVGKKTAAGVLRSTDLIFYDTEWAEPEYHAYASAIPLTATKAGLFWSTQDASNGPARIRYCEVTVS